MDWQIARDAADAVRRHAAEAHPDEACGLLLGRAGRIEEARRAGNVAAAPDRTFEIDPAALFRAQRGARAGGPALVGYYHSHPNGRLEPSRTDAQRAQPDGKLWLIAAHGEIAAYLAGSEGIYNRFLTIGLHETEG